jgi:hypothetical protein
MIEPQGLLGTVTEQAMLAHLMRGLVRGHPSPHEKRIFLTPEYLELCRLWMAMTLCDRFPGLTYLDPKALRKQLASLYVRIVMSPLLKDSLMLAVFVLGYFIHEQIYHHLPQFNSSHDTKFVF